MTNIYVTLTLFAFPSLTFPGVKKFPELKMLFGTFF